MNKIDYEAQANGFLRKTATEMTSVYLGERLHFPNDKEKRDCYQITLQNSRGVYSFQFGDSVANTEKNRRRIHRAKPTAYDVLACLTKHETEESVDDFAASYGIEKPSEAIRLHKAVREEWEGVQRLWTPAEIELLAEIQ